MLYKICTLNFKDNKIVLVVLCTYSRLQISSLVALKVTLIIIIIINY